MKVLAFVGFGAAGDASAAAAGAGAAGAASSLFEHAVSARADTAMSVAKGKIESRGIGFLPRSFPGCRSYSWNGTAPTN
jgi:hypothetical protein